MILVMAPRLLLALLAAAVLFAALPAVADEPSPARLDSAGPVPEPTPAVAPRPTPGPETVRWQPGTEVRPLLPGELYETALYVNTGAEPGPAVMVVGGTHGNEPAGWTAAEQLIGLVPDRGRLLVIPRANTIAIDQFVRTLPELGDLNRLYPGRPDGLPMEQLAWEITRLVGEYRVQVFVDLHESWGFYQDRVCPSTAFLGQTVAVTNKSQAVELLSPIVDGLNARLAGKERFTLLVFGRPGSPPPPNCPPTPLPSQRQGGYGGTSTNMLARTYEPLITVLIETSTQLPLGRRVGFHLEIVRQILVAQGMLGS
jgi:hypothetical protein